MPQFGHITVYPLSYLLPTLQSKIRQKSKQFIQTLHTHKNKPSGYTKISNKDNHILHIYHTSSHKELVSAANFISYQLSLTSPCLHYTRLLTFRDALLTQLVNQKSKHQSDHLITPWKKQWESAIIIHNSQLDKRIIEAGLSTFLSTQYLEKRLPKNLVVWIFPDEVQADCYEEDQEIILYSSQVQGYKDIYTPVIENL